METSCLRPPAGCFLERAPPSLSPAGRGRSLNQCCLRSQGWRERGGTGTPPGEGPGASAAGRLPRRPAPRPPPAPPAASAAARRSSAAFPAQSVSPRRWVSGGRSAGARGCEEGASRRRGPTSWTPQSCRSRTSQEFSLRGPREWGCPRETRGALQGPDHRVASLGAAFRPPRDAPSRRDHAPGALPELKGLRRGPGRELGRGLERVSEAGFLDSA